MKLALPVRKFKYGTLNMFYNLTIYLCILRTNFKQT